MQNTSIALKMSVETLRISDVCNLTENTVRSSSSTSECFADVESEGPGRYDSLNYESSNPDSPIDLSTPLEKANEPLNLTKFHDLSTPPDTPTHPGGVMGFKKNILKRYGKNSQALINHYFAVSLSIFD